MSHTMFLFWIMLIIAIPVSISAGYYLYGVIPGNVNDRTTAAGLIAICLFMLIMFVPMRRMWNEGMNTKDAAIENLNYIEYQQYYIDYEKSLPWWQTQGIPIHTVVSTEFQHLRICPSDTCQAIVTIPAGTNISLMKFRQDGDWLYLRHSGKIGWINGTRFRPIMYKEKSIFTPKVIETIVKYGLPGESAKTRFLYIGLGFAISIAIYIFGRGDETLEYVRIGSGFIYFGVTNAIIYEMSLSELHLMALGIALVTTSVHFLSKFAIDLLLQDWN